MYSLDCTFYSKAFKTINELIDDVITSGMDPNYWVTKDGHTISEKAIDFIQF